MSEPTKKAVKPKLRAAQRWNVVWAVPILAILIGGWMLYKDISAKGPEIRIRFETADGIVAGKTELRCRSVTVGRVTRVELDEDLNSVLVYCELEQDSDSFLRRSTRFWVVRPRVSTADISGLGTLLTGAYIELEPGEGKKGARNFKGLEIPPATSRSVPGLRLTLITEDAGPLAPGSPMYYRGFEVGRIESRRLDTDRRRIIYEAFIEEEYQDLVRVNTRFWNTSGIDISGGVDGFKIRTPSVQAMVSGGVSFAVEEGVDVGPLAADGTAFVLHEDAASADSASFEPTLRVLLLFDQSVRGLSKSAPVQYRGITIGRVANISFEYALDSDNRRVPVLVEIDPNLLRASSGRIDPEDEIPRLEEAIRRGLRATLKTGSLLTGALYVDFDYYDDQGYFDKLVYLSDFPIVPSIPSGFSQIEVRLASIMEKIDKLPFEKTVTQMNDLTASTQVTMEEAKLAIKEIELAAAAAKETMTDARFLALPENITNALAEVEKSIASVGPDGTLQGDILRTLDELRASVRSFDVLVNTIEEKPNSIFFGKEDSGNPKPRAAGRR